MKKLTIKSREKIERVFTRRAAKYDSESPWMKHHLATRPFIPEPFGGRQALDLCAGTGLITKALVDEGWDAVALDLTSSMLKDADILGRVVADATCTPFQSSIFDLIVCRQGLHYLDEGAAASELSRLRPKEIRLGQIVAPNEDIADWWYDLFKTLAPGRKRVYMPSDLEKFVDKLVGTWAVNIIKFSLIDYFSQNFKHLQGRHKTIAETMVRDMPREISGAMEVDGDVYRQDWEVIIASAID